MTIAKVPLAKIAGFLAAAPPGLRCLLVEEPPGDDFGAITTTSPTDGGLAGLGAAVARERQVVFPLDPHVGRFIIGRRSHSDICIADRRVSGAHASLELAAPGEYWLTDLGSSNGTLWKGVALARGEQGRVLVKAGASFKIAEVHVLLLDVARLHALATS